MATLFLMSETILSRHAFERLQAELEDLTTRGRVEIAHAIETARALGDLSENGDYHAAKDSQGKMEARIRELQFILSSAKVAEGEASADGTVGVGSVVGLRYQGESDVEEYLVGSIEEKRDGVDVISPGSPLGRALLGKAAGVTVEYEAPGGMLQVEVVRVGS